jgi:hypothetical protein
MPESCTSMWGWRRCFSACQGSYNFARKFICYGLRKDGPDRYRISWAPCPSNSCFFFAYSILFLTMTCIKFFFFQKTNILLQRSARLAFWPSPYLDAFGEEVEVFLKFKDRKHIINVNVTYIQDY